MVQITNYCTYNIMVINKIHEFFLLFFIDFAQYFLYINYYLNKTSVEGNKLSKGTFREHPVGVRM